MMGGPHAEIIYSNTPGPYPSAPQPHLVQPGLMGGSLAAATKMPGLNVGPELTDTRPRDYGSSFKGGPRQEISGPAYQDQTRPSPLSEVHSQAHHAADYNKTLNQQRDMRNDYLQGIWRRPHEQPNASGSLNTSTGPSDSNVPATSRATTSPHATSTSMSQPAVSAQSPQMMMTSPPYSQSIHAQNPVGQPPMRGSSGAMSQGAQGYNYQSGQPVWSQSPQAPQHGYASYTTQGQSPHPSQSPAPHLRTPSGSGQMQPNMHFPGMPSMQYGSGQGMYADQTPRGYMQPNTPGAPAVSQAWSSQHSPPQQWWAPSQPPQ